MLCIFYWSLLPRSSAPMGFFLVGVPILLVIFVLPNTGQLGATAAVVAYVCAVLVLQARVGTAEGVCRV